MARYLTITCMAQPPFPAHPNETPEEALPRVISAWRERLDLVLPDRPDVIVLPEYCDLPSREKSPGWLREYYSGRGAQVRDALADIAARHRCHIAYTAVRRAREDGSFRNTLELIDRQGRTAGVYHKNFLIHPEREEGNLSDGGSADLIVADFGTVGCAVCFDLNFDELRARYAASRPDLILFSSLYHGGLMQQYWAYSCRAHFAAAIGGTPPSAVLSPVGQILAESTNYQPFVTQTVNLDCAVVHLDHNTEKLARLKAAHGPAVRIQDPGRLGSVLLSSESADFSAGDLLEEFQIERLDDYLARCRADRNAAEPAARAIDIV